MANYYVSPSGNDSNDGSIGSPKQTLNGGVNVLSGGDTLNVAPGTYSERLNTNSIPSGLGFPVGATRIQKWGTDSDANPIMRGNVWISAKSNIIWDGIDINGIDNGTPSGDGDQEDFTNIYINGGTNIRFENCEVYNASKLNILTHDGNGALDTIEFVNLSVHDAGQGGWTSVNEPANHNFYLSAHNDTAAGCESYNALGPGANSWGIQVYSTDTGFLDGVTVRNCFVHDNNQGIVIGSGDNHKVYNNIVYNSVSASSFSEAAVTVGYGTCDNIQVYNNTIVGNVNGAYAISVGTFGTVTNTLIKNNILWQNSHDSVNVAGGASGTVQTDNSTSDPVFITPGSDFHLDVGSSLFGAGVNLYAIFTTDKDGNARPTVSAWTIGAYESGTGEEGGAGGGGGGGSDGGGGGVGVGGGGVTGVRAYFLAEGDDVILMPNETYNSLIPSALMERDVFLTSHTGKITAYKRSSRRRWSLEYLCGPDDKAFFETMHKAVDGIKTPFYFMEDSGDADTAVLVRKQEDFMPRKIAPGLIGSTFGPRWIYTLDLTEMIYGSLSFATGTPPGGSPGTVVIGTYRGRPTIVEEYEDNPPVNPLRSRVLNGSNAIDADDSTYAELQMDSCTSVSLDFANLQISGFPSPPAGTVSEVTISVIAEYIPGISGGSPFGPTFAEVDIFNQRNPDVLTASWHTGFVAALCSGTVATALPRAIYSHTFSATDWATQFSSDAANIYVRCNQHDSGNFTLSTPSLLRISDCYIDYLLTA